MEREGEREFDFSNPAATFNCRPCVVNPSDVSSRVLHPFRLISFATDADAVHRLCSPRNRCGIVMERYRADSTCKYSVQRLARHYVPRSPCLWE